MNWKWLGLSLISAFASVAGILVAAEPEAVTPRRPAPPGDFEPGRPRVSQSLPRPGGLPFEAVLTPDQRAVFRDEMLSQREKLRELDEKSSTLRRELDEALFADKLDEKLVRDKGAALADLETERSLIRARAFAKIRPRLSDEQIERMKSLRAEIGRGNRMGQPRPEPGGERPRPQRPPREPGELDVLPPPAPAPGGPRPPGPPPAPEPR